MEKNRPWCTEKGTRLRTLVSRTRGKGQTGKRSNFNTGVLYLEWHSVFYDVPLELRDLEMGE